MGVSVLHLQCEIAAMDAIKKKMQAMKVEKDNAMDRSDVCEQAAKDAKVRAAKAEEEVAELVKKAQQLEGELETCEDKLLQATNKLDKAATAGDDSDRMRKVLENRAIQDADRMGKLEEELKNARNQAEEADKQYDEVQKRLQQVESELERAEERAETGEMKIIELEEELRVVATNLKSLEVSEDKANKREASYKEQIKTLTAKLKQAEARAEFAERSVQKLQKEVDRLEDELAGEQEKYKAITEELEATFAEMSGY